MTTDTIVHSTPGYTPAFNLKALAPADVSAICAHFHLPLPTPDVPLEAIASAAALTPQSIYADLSDTTDIRLMIAAAALRGSLTRLPPDPRLNPLPHKKAPVKTPKTAAEAERSPPPPPVPVAADRRVLVSVAPNPKRPGSASRDRYNLYKVGMTEPELIATGVLAADLRWDTSRSFLVWGELPEATE